MKTGVALLFCWIFPVVTAGCCQENQSKAAGLQQDLKYRAVEGEIFMMPCRGSTNKLTKWVKTEEDEEEKKITSFDCKRKFVTEVKHSGTYNNSEVLLTLQVVDKLSLRCFQPDESSVTLRGQAGGTLGCPGLACSPDADVVWYKEHRAVSEQRRKSCQHRGLLQLCRVYDEDSGVFFCDRRVVEGGVAWTLRRAVSVTVVPHFEATTSPEITYPSANESEEVEVGRPHSLICKAYFDFEITVSRDVQWFVNYGGDTRNTTPLHMETPQVKQLLNKKVEVIQRATIREVMTQHLNHTYTCVARNAVGNRSVTIVLKLRKQVRWPSLVGYPFACFLLVAGLGLVLHLNRLEIQIIVRSRLQFEKHTSEEKTFDVFLSHVWSCQSNQAEGSKYGLYHQEEEMLNVTPQTSQSPEVLLPQVLEDQWGYRVCLLERDILPGGAYTNDVVLALKRSRMLVCVLSAEYLSDTRAVFVLESGVKALLQRSALKLLLIRTAGPSASRVQPDPPLPELVQKSLKVLPSLDWSPDRSSTAARRFWTSLRRAMPGGGAAVSQVKIGNTFPSKSVPK